MPFFMPFWQIFHENCNIFRIFPWKWLIYSWFTHWRCWCSIDAAVSFPISIDWFSWENLHREPSIFPMKIMGLSCKFSLKPIQWHRQPGHGRSGRRRLEPRLSRGRGSLRGADAQVQGMIIGMGENLRPKGQQIGLYIVVYFWLWSYLIVDWFQHQK